MDVVGGGGGWLRWVVGDKTGYWYQALCTAVHRKTTIMIPVFAGKMLIQGWHLLCCLDVGHKGLV